MNPIYVLLAAATAPAPNAETEEIVVTGAREPVVLEDAAISATLYDAEAIEALALPMAADLLRLAPGAAIANGGPRGTQTQLRIRGAEANHSLLFVDGIRFNDPAAGNEARFELLTGDALSRIELVRGPQSALWGSEALGGVVAAVTADPLRQPGGRALAEYGSEDSGRASARGAARFGDIGISGSAGWMASNGIDSFGGAGGDRDGFENRSASVKAAWRPLAAAELGLVGHNVGGESEYDGFDPATFRRADTLDATENRIVAIRGWASGETGGWSLLGDMSYLDSANRNRLGKTPLNSTFGERWTAGGQVSRGIGGHRLTAAVEHEGENFRARDQVYLGGTDQDRSRELTALIGQWRAGWSARLITDVAIRHDRFSEYDDVTTIRATALLRPLTSLTLQASYGEGIAQPTFYDLYGFFPGSFQGNATLRTESSRGWEAGFRWRGERFGLGLTAFSNRLKDEIVDTFDQVTGLSSTANAFGNSRRRGIEAEADYEIGGFDLRANYTYLQASERRVAGAAGVREVRRPRHSANLSADGRLGPVAIGLALSYVGARRDTDFDIVQTVTLNDYLLGAMRIGYQVTPLLEAYARVENGFGADYQDVVGYNTPGRSFHAGLRVRLGR